MKTTTRKTRTWMGVNGNGIGNGPPAQPAAKSVERRPRRLVLLAGERDGAVEEVLAEYRGTEVSGGRLHADLQRQAAAHPGKVVAAEWLGPLGWTRFLWGRK